MVSILGVLSRGRYWPRIVGFSPEEKPPLSAGTFTIDRSAGIVPGWDGRRKYPQRPRQFVCPAVLPMD